ncbi:kinase-like domain-containing protein, partial [Amanita rubescens]
MPRNPSRHTPPLTLLLSILRENKHGSSIASIVNTSTIELTYNLLLAEDYVNIASQLSNASDIIILLDFLLYLLHHGHLTKLDVNGRARRLMMKIIKTTPVMPRSLFVTGIKMKDNREYLGGGGFGHVFKGKLGGEAVALKLLFKTQNNIDFCREALMWKSLKHKFVLPFLGIYETESATQFFLVSPYMKNGTLSQWRKDIKPSVAEIQERRTLILVKIREVAQGIQYIHSEGVVHGDLRGDNILLDSNFHVQITDFGLTRHSETTITRTGCLHYNFAAPELFGFIEGDAVGGSSDEDEQMMARTQRSDIYAFGCLYYEIHYDVMPFEGLKEVQIMRLISHGDRPSRREEPPLSDAAWELIQSCWVANAAKRPTIEDIAEKM